MEHRLPLNKIPIGYDCIISSIEAVGSERRRILDLGFIENTKIHVIRRSPLGDPTAYLIRDTTIALRKEEACKIIVKIEEANNGFNM